MRIKVIPGAPACDLVPPKEGGPLPSSFVPALQTAARFAGKHYKKLADGQFVHIMDGKAYASNNRHIVEIDLGNLPFPALRLNKRDISLLASMGDAPKTCSIEGEHVTFVWPDRRWLRVEAGDASTEFVANCKHRFEHYWQEPEGVLPDPKSIDLLLNSKPKGSTVSTSVSGFRAIAHDGGFFFQSDKANASALIMNGKINPLRDNLFAEAIKETKDAQKANATRIARLKKRLRAIQADIASLEATSDDLEARLTRQHDAVDAYQNGDTLDADQQALLAPQCHELVKDEEKRALEKEFTHHEAEIPDGWEITGKRQDADHIYVTIRKERVTASKPATTAAAMVKKALARFFKPEFDRDFRIRWDQLGTLAPIMRGAP